MLADVAYVDMLEGDTECHVRFNTPEDAQTVMKSHKDLQIKNNWKYEILTGKSCCLFVVFCGFLLPFFLIVEGDNLNIYVLQLQRLTIAHILYVYHVVLRWLYE